MAAERYVLVKGDLGLGNRILALLSAVLLARLTRRRLVVDWRDGLYAAPGCDAFAALLRVAGAAPIADLPDTDSVCPPPWRGRLRDPAHALREERVGPHYLDPWLWEPFCVPLGRLERAETVLVFTCFFDRVAPLARRASGELASLRSLAEDEVLARLWAQALCLQPGLQERVASFRRARLAGHTIGAHVRASDRRARAGAIEARVARRLARCPGARVFLATDNADVLHRWRERFPDVASVEKWYPPPGEPMHLHAARPDPLRGAADALVDLYLLAGCDCLVVDSQSSFGRLAALRARAEGKRVDDLYPGRFLPRSVRTPLLRVASYARRLAARGTAAPWLPE